MNMALTTESVVVGGRGRWGVKAKPAVQQPQSGAVDAPALGAAASDRRRRPWGQRYASRIAVTDLIALVLASIAVHLVRFPTLQSDVLTDPIYLPYIGLTVTLLLVWIFALGSSGSRDPKSIGYGAVEYK